jgi:hypothetical protein
MHYKKEEWRGFKVQTNQENLAIRYRIILHFGKIKELMFLYYKVDEIRILRK